MYLSFGMTARQFWHGEPYLATAYRKADELKRKRQNETLWLQGMYVYEAFSVVMANAFKKKGATAAKYAERPYDIFPKTAAEKEAEKKAEQERIRAYFENMRLSWKRTHEERTG